MTDLDKAKARLGKWVEFTEARKGDHKGVNVDLGAMLHDVNCILAALDASERVRSAACKALVRYRRVHDSKFRKKADKCGCAQCVSAREALAKEEE